MIGGKPLIFMGDSAIPPESCETPSVRGDQTCGDLTCGDLTCKDLT